MADEPKETASEHINKLAVEFGTAENLAENEQQQKVIKAMDSGLTVSPEHLAEKEQRRIANAMDSGLTVSPEHLAEKEQRAMDRDFSPEQLQKIQHAASTGAIQAYDPEGPTGHPSGQFTPPPAGVGSAVPPASRTK